MRKFIIMAACAAAMAGAAHAQGAPDQSGRTSETQVQIGTGEAAPENDAPLYQVTREDISIAFAGRTITAYRIGRDKSLILEAIGNRFYRAELDVGCQRDLRWETRIGVRFPAGSLRRNDYAVIDGRQCRLLTLDEIADPRPADQAARAAEANP